MTRTWQSRQRKIWRNSLIPSGDMKTQPVKFWVAVGTVKQLSFRDDGTTYEVEKDIPVGEQHIQFREVLMCKQSRDMLMKKKKATKKKIAQTRLPNVPMCATCEEGYK